MNYASSAPTRQPVPDLPEPDHGELPELQEGLGDGEQMLAYLQLLWSRRGLLWRLAVYALLASTLLAFVIPARYESTARLMPPDSQSGSGLAAAVAAMSGAAGGLGGMAGDLLGMKSNSDVFVGILGSRTVQDKLIQQFDLKKLYWDRRMEDARRDLSGHTNISVDRKSQIISVTVSDRKPERAAAMTSAYVEELNRLVAELSTSSARRERIFLEGRLQAVNQELETAEKEFSQFASKNTAIDIKEQGRAMVEAAATLQGRLIAAQSEYEGLRQIYSDNNVRVRSVKARIDELENQLNKIGGKGESPTTSSASPATTSTSPSGVAAQQNDTLYPSIRKLPLLGVEFADLYRRTKIQEAVLEALTKEYEMAKVQEAKEIPTVKVLDSSNIPEKRSYPPRVLIVVAGTLLALGVGSAWVIGEAAWNSAESSDPRKVFAQEVFTTVRARLPQFARNGSKNVDLNLESPTAEKRSSR